MFNLFHGSNVSKIRSKGIFKNLLLLPILFLLLSIPLSAHDYSVSTSATTSGGGTWGSILQMDATLNGYDLDAAEQKQSGSFENISSTNPSVSLTAPNSGSYNIGDNMSISWSASNQHHFGLYLLKAGSEVATIYHTSSNSSSRSYQWTIPSLIDGHTINGSNYQIGIAVWNSTGASVGDESSSYISITPIAPPTVSLNSPNSGSFNIGNNMSISWSSTNQHHFGLYLVKAGVEVATIYHTSSNSSSRSYQWTIPSSIDGHTINGSNYQIGIAVWNSAGASVGDESSSYISITPIAPPTVSLNSPNSGSFNIGNNMSISWSSTNQHHFGLYLVKAGVEVATIYHTSSNSSSRSYQWTIPSSIDGHTINGSNYQIGIAVWNSTGASVGDESSSYISITPIAPPTVSLNSPNSGSFNIGDNMSISWSSTNQHHFGLYLVKAGVEVATIYHTASNSSSRSYQWTIPSSIDGHTINGSNYQIGIAVWNSAGASVGDESSSTISITPVPGAPTVTLNSPNSGSFNVGEKMNIGWSSTNQHHFGLYLVKAGVEVATIYHTSSNSSSRSYQWTIPSSIDGHTINGSNYQIGIAVWNSAGASVGDESSSNISITPVPGAPTVTLSSPDSGSFNVGDKMNISWSSTNQHHFGLYLVKAGVEVATIYHTSSNSSSRSYQWPIPSSINGHTINGSNYQIGIAVWNSAGASVGDESNSNLTIAPKIGTATVNIISPGNGASVSGNQVTIRATVTCDCELSKVEVYIDDFLTGTFTQPSINWDYIFDWDTTVYSNDSHTIRVVAYDLSNQYSDDKVTVTVNNSAYNLEVDNFLFGNVGDIANEFQIWIDILKGDHPVNPSNYELRIVEPGNPYNIYATQVGEIITIDQQGKRWKATLKMNKAGALYFENGVLQIINGIDNQIHNVPSSKLSISVYGTDFHMKTHAYRFQNGHWDKNLPKIFHKVSDTVQNYISPFDIGKWWLKITGSGGLCYGMAHSTAANYNHRDDSKSHWGEDCANYKTSFCRWKNDEDNSYKECIDERWRGNNPPDGDIRPFSDENIFTETYNDIQGRWNLEAAKKIMYYHLSNWNYAGFWATNWVGRDKDYKCLYKNLIRLLKYDNIALLVLGALGNHAVDITQIIKWNDNVKFVIYDNRYTSSDSETYNKNKPKEEHVAYFLEMLIDNANDFIQNEMYLRDRKSKLRKIRKWDGNEMVSVTGEISCVVVNEIAASQKIYNVPSESFSHLTLQNQSDNGQNKLYNFGTNSFRFDYIEVIAIGAENVKVFNQKTSRPIQLISNGDLDGNQAVYIHKSDSILSRIYLPANDNIYRLEITKNPQVPRLKIFPYVPKGKDIIESVGYDNIHFQKNDATRIVFLVGKNNTDYSLQRTSEQNSQEEVQPDYMQNGFFEKTLVITSPNGNENLIGNTQDNISWLSTDIITDVKIELSTGGGTNFSEIIASTPNDGTYEWATPNITSANCLIRITDVSDDSVSDISDSVFSITSGSQGTPKIKLSRRNLVFAAVTGGAITNPQQVFIYNKKSGTLNWTAAPSHNWLNVSPSSGTGDKEITISVDSTGISVGTYTGTITVTDPNASNSPQTITVTLTVKGSGEKPFGEFSTPLDGSAVFSSVPVSGWALDDIEVVSVKIYQSQGSKPLQYVGDALFVEGARIDLQYAYPDYPLNYKGGWGYMLLTNFLPNGGNGTYKLHAVATDKEGNRVTLGTKTIRCNNSTAKKPFGAIDTPPAGGSASGNNYSNIGWVLTPMPNKIPENGSTIDVYVNGIKLGNPTYNQYREDIATYFPGNANSNGAQATFKLDTTDYKNGIHSIYWIATDNAGNADGIGSRFFTIQNTSGSRTAQAQKTTRQKYYEISEISEIPIDNSTPIKLKKGYKLDNDSQIVNADENNNFNIHIRELERIKVRLHPDKYPTGKITGQIGYQIAGDHLIPLPIGTTFDIENGIFYWQPGPGFTGQYRFVFIVEYSNGEKTKRFVTVTISPQMDWEEIKK